VLLFVMDRTVGWGKRWEIITQRHFLLGIPSHEKHFMDYAGSLKMSLNTLKHALRTLIKAGIILEKKGCGRNRNLTAYALSEKIFFELPDDVKAKGER
jgi:hypothetical protein